MGIRRRIAILIFVSALPLFLVSVYNVNDLRHEEREKARRDTLVLANTLAALQADVLINIRQLLHGLAAGYEEKPEELFGSTCVAVLRRVAQANPLLSNVLVADASGDIRCSVVPANNVNVSDREYFRTALSDGAFTISKPIQGRVLGNKIVVAALPVIGPQASIVVLASIETARLSDVFEQATLPSEIEVTLVDDTGQALARRPHVDAYVGTAFEGFRRARQDLRHADHGMATLPGLDGVSRIAAYARLPKTPGSPMYVVAGVPESAVDRKANHDLIRSLAVTGLTLFLALVVALFGAQRLIVAPLRKLTAAAVRYGRGDLNARSGLAHEPGEVGTLADAFDRLAANHSRAARALRALSAGNRTLLREKNEKDLLNAMCKVVVEQAGYRLVFVSYLEHDQAKSVRIAASAGHDAGFLEALKVTWEDSDRGRGSVGTAIRSKQACIVHSMAKDPRFLPWRQAALERGYGSIASFPLHVDGNVIGTLSIIAAEEDAFDQHEVQLLDEMAADLSFGIETIRSTGRRLVAEEFAQRARTHDPLTGLPGRIPFLVALETALTQAAHEQKLLAVVVLRLTALEDLQASLGYDATNFAVLEAAARLQNEAAPRSYFLARIAADDFALLLPGVDASGVAEHGERLQQLFNSPVSAGALSVDPRVSAGGTVYPAHGTKAELLLRRATLAAAEAARRELPFFLYRGTTEREDPERVALAVDLRRAIEERQLLLHFQPKVDLLSGAVSGVEALVRWPHPTKGAISPMLFVTIAERTGLIRQLTNVVIEQAVRQARQWRERGMQIPIAVNLSPRNLHDPQLIEQLDYLLRAWDVPSELLHFEITEGALVEDPENARKVLQRLRDLGGKLYIDDFGTGYSSLSYLVSLPVDAVKIDRSFVKQMTKSRQAHSVVASIILMAHELGLRVVAEGVETEEDSMILRNLKCDEAQGYFFGRPVPGGEFKA